MGLIQYLLHIVLTPADNGSITVPTLNCTDRQVCCSYSGTASGVKKEGGACYIEGVGHSICERVHSRPDIKIILVRHNVIPIRVRWKKDPKLTHARNGFCIGPSSEGTNITSSVIDAGVEEREEG